MLSREIELEMSGRSQGARGNYRGGRGYRGGWQRGRGGGYYRGSGRGRGSNRGGGRGQRPSGSSQSQAQNNSQTGPRLIQTTLLDQQTPYKGWKLYFPTELYSDQSPVVQRVRVYEEFLTNWTSSQEKTNIETKRYFTLDYNDLKSDEAVIGSLPELDKEVREMPESVLNCLSLAMHQVISKKLEREAVEDSMLGIDGTPVPVPPVFLMPRIHCRITNYEPVTPLKHLKANYYGKFVSVKGTVVRVSNIKPLCRQLAFECLNCGHIQGVILPDGKFIIPTSCPAHECRSRSFAPRRSHSLTETIDWQTIRVQEIMNDDQRESGRIPRTVDCELTHDLVDSCVPGDMVSVSGIVKVMSSDEGRGRSKDKCMFLLYILANSVTNMKGRKVGNSPTASGDETTTGMAVEFTTKELYAIEQIQSEDNLFRLIVGSICPSIYGHELVKAGLVLGLFGGTQKHSQEKNNIPVRGDPHVLVVGDPGLGKSQMLQALANVAPRSVYVCGNTTTTSGLTVTLSREAGAGGDYALEAGALVLADQGCCCIDEFDKMGSQHQALLEAMEQQSISIAKAGIVCSLPARTSIIAAANPVGGHYNKAKTVSENLRMGSALLSRFDLVFILLDKPDEEMDSMLSDYVMSLHGGKKKSKNKDVAETPNHSQVGNDEMRAQLESEKPLTERLKLPRGEAFDPIPAQLLRKYVSYARKFVHPKIGHEAAKVIQDFYLDLRRKHQTQDSTPITTRQLESLIRLSEARARLELREDVTEEDAQDVVHIMKYSMVDTFMDSFGFLDFQRSQHGSGMSSRSQAKRLIAQMQRITEQTCNSLFTVQEMRQIANEAGIKVPNFEDFVSSLNNQGYLLKKGPRVYKLQTAFG